MDIAFFHGFNSYPPVSGASVHVYQLISNFIKQGHTVHCFDYEKNPDVVKHTYSRNNTYKLVKNVDIVYVRIDGRYHNEKINSYKILNLFKTPIVWEINSPIEEWLVLGSKKHEFLKKLIISNRSFKRKILAKYTSSAICVSKGIQRYACNYLLIDNSYVIPNGSDPEMFTPSKKNGRLWEEYRDYYKILWAGSPQYPWQGVDIIEKLSRIFLGEKILFIIIANKRELSYKFNNNNTVIINEIPYLEIPEYFASVDLALCLYHDLKFSKWGFHFSPLKLYDYMSSGIPVIGSNLGQIKEVIKSSHNGILTNNNIEDITQKILYLKNNPKEAKQIGNNARETIINNYNWKRTSDDILRIMEQMV